MPKKVTQSPERKAEIILASCCLGLIVALTVGTLLFWFSRPYAPRANGPRVKIEDGQFVLTAQKAAQVYKNGEQLLSLEENGAASVTQTDWATPLTGYWIISPQQTIIVEITSDQLWRQREFTYQTENLIDKENNSAWRRQK